MESVFPELNSLLLIPKVCDVRKIGEMFSLKLLLSVLPTNSANLCPHSFIVREHGFVTNDNMLIVHIHPACFFKTGWKDMNYKHMAQGRDCKHGIKHSGSRTGREYRD